MKLYYKPTKQEVFDSIHVSRVQEPYLGDNWHFHEEYELIYFLEGAGIRIVGDNISTFHEGELVLVGEWLPHLWRNNDDGTGNSKVDFVVIKFLKTPHDVHFFSLPEFGAIRGLLEKSRRGILFPSSILPNIHDLILNLCASQSSMKLVHFLHLFHLLAEEDDYQLLSSPNFLIPEQVSGENRLQKIIHFVAKHYRQKISLEEISDLVHLSPTAFCRFFKSRTNNTFSQFLNEFRVNQACLMLINGEKSIKQICFEVGFHSLTNFNRTFKSMKGVSPSTYQRAHHQFLNPENLTPNPANIRSA
ncbi:MAG: AraC family transcriptional regulator [Bacteroidota bacterium]